MRRDVRVVADVMLVAALVVALVVAACVVRRRATRGSACCGEHEQAPSRVRVRDRNKAHYAFATTLSIGGMTCDNCAARVENALNEMPDTWAKVSIASREAIVRTKAEPDLERIRAAVAHAGYVVL